MQPLLLMFLAHSGSGMLCSVCIGVLFFCSGWKDRLELHHLTTLFATVVFHFSTADCYKCLKTFQHQTALKVLFTFLKYI